MINKRKKLIAEYKDVRTRMKERLIDFLGSLVIWRTSNTFMGNALIKHDETIVRL